MAGLDPRDESRVPLVTRWLEFTAWLMKTGARMPKHWRPSLVNRLEGEALEILLKLTEASYRRRKLTLLTEANVRLSRLRILMELAHTLKALSPGAHERALVATDEVGRMLGGWIREVRAREKQGKAGKPGPRGGGSDEDARAEVQKT